MSDLTFFENAVRNLPGVLILVDLQGRIQAVNETAQTISVVTWEDEIGADEMLARRRYRRLSLSWLEPPQARRLLEDAGFVVEACFGDFDRTPFSANAAREQVWIAGKPR